MGKPKHRKNATALWERQLDIILDEVAHIDEEVWRMLNSRTTTKTGRSSFTVSLEPSNIEQKAHQADRYCRIVRAATQSLRDSLYNPVATNPTRPSRKG